MVFSAFIFFLAKPRGDTQFSLTIQDRFFQKAFETGVSYLAVIECPWFTRASGTEKVLGACFFEPGFIEILIVGLFWNLLILIKSIQLYKFL